jgi:hypothetical protein
MVLVLLHDGKLIKRINLSYSLLFFSLVAVLKLSEIERDLCNKGLFEYISVQVAVSLTWFIRRLAANYLGFDEQSYQDGNCMMYKSN